MRFIGYDDAVIVNAVGDVRPSVVRPVFEQVQFIASLWTMVAEIDFTRNRMLRYALYIARTPCIDSL